MPFGQSKAVTGVTTAAERIRVPAIEWRMTDNPNPFADLDLERGIALRWMLRDIKARRSKLSPVSDADLSALMDLGLVEMRDDAPVLTNAGHAALD